MKHPKSYNSNKKTRERMSKVHLKGGKAEVLLAHSLWNKGMRYRKNYKELPGSPDIALTKYKIAIFVDGEFWHGYDWEHKRNNLKRNREYWISKIEENMARDKRNDQLLTDRGWTVLHFWEKQVLKNTDYCIELIFFHIRSRQ